MQNLKKLISSLCIIALFLGSPILMDHAKDVYLAEVVAKKANPVKYKGRVFGSSFQLRYAGHTVTVTNHHVCNVMRKIMLDKELSEVIKHAERLEKTKMSKSAIRKWYHEQALRLARKKYNIIGQNLSIGEYSRTILYESKSHDICFLTPTGGPSFSLASNVHRGEAVTIIGHPRGHEQSISDGRITGSELNPHPTMGIIVRSLKSTALSYPGNSGSPVVNRYGNVVGILYAGYPSDFTNVNFVVPLEYIKADFEQYLYERNTSK